jgi:hypothetical protein
MLVTRFSEILMRERRRKSERERERERERESGRERERDREICKKGRYTCLRREVKLQLNLKNCNLTF